MFSPKSDIIPIWQPVGQSTYQITMEVAKILRKKTAHTGVLDPLAEGVIVVLAGDERFNKMACAGWKKTYEFDVAFGIATDSYDGLGLITKEQPAHKNDLNNLHNKLSGFVGPYVQKVPLYSAKKLNGKRLFEYPKLGLKVDELPEKSGEIFSLEIVEIKKVKLFDLVENILKNITQVKHGDFRQEITKQCWINYVPKTENKTLTIASFRTELSRGLYVRSLSQDIAEAIGEIGFVSKLVRTGNGDYTRNGDFDQSGCYRLEDLLK